MHQGHIDDAVEVAAARGWKVAVFARNIRETEPLARRFENDSPPGAISKVSRVAGRRSLDFHGGGRIYFISLGQSARGLTADRVLVPRDAPCGTLAAIVPMTATSEDGQITGY